VQCRKAVAARDRHGLGVGARVAAALNPHPAMRRLLSRPAAAFAVALLAMLAAPGQAGPTPPPPGDAAAPAVARVIVTLKADAPMLREHALSARQSAGAAASMVQRRTERLASRAGVALESGPAISERAQVVMARGIDAGTLARRLAADPQVQYAVVDQRRRALLVPNDPLYARGPTSGRGPDSGQWYLRAPAAEVQSSVNAEGAWERVTGSPSVVVAVLDTGVLADHLDLAGRVLPGYDMVSDVATANDGDGRDADAGDPGDWVTAAEDGARGGSFSNCRAAPSTWHGTKVAGLIGAAANDGQGMAGTAWGVKILPLRVLGKCGGFDSDIQAGMRWAAGLNVPGLPANPHPARVLNLSLGGGGACDAASGYPQVIAEVLATGAVVVAAAGNSAGRNVELPANCPGVIAVAGLRHVGSKVGFSDLGSAIAISAPAGNCINIGANEPCLYPILSSSNSGTQRPNAGGSIWTDSFNLSVGTSFAAPIVAGTAALMLSARPQLLPQELLRAMQASARPFPTSGAGNDENGQPVPMCRAPDGSNQSQCYCSVGLCGAGMLDAASAVLASTGTLARIGVDPLAPRVGDTLLLSAAPSLPGSGRSVVAYAWSLAGNPGVVAGFSGATNGPDASLLASGVGTVTVQLLVTDDSGQQSSAQRSIEVIAAPVPAPPPEPSASAPAGGGGGGGGASSLLWVGLLGLAVAALLHARRRHPGQAEVQPLR
jgi:serine protease